MASRVLHTPGHQSSLRWGPSASPPPLRPRRPPRSANSPDTLPSVGPSRGWTLLLPTPPRSSLPLLLGVLPCSYLASQKTYLKLQASPRCSTFPFVHSTSRLRTYHRAHLLHLFFIVCLSPLECKLHRGENLILILFFWIFVYSGHGCIQSTYKNVSHVAKMFVQWYTATSSQRHIWNNTHEHRLAYVNYTTITQWDAEQFLK